MSSPTATPSAAGVHVVLAVKDLLNAKSRLAEAVPDVRRRDLVLAMLADTLSAVARTPQVAGVHVVTRDDAVAATAVRWGAAVLADPDVDGLNPALAHAAATIPHRPLVALQADLPALRPAELAAALDAAAGHLRCFVADRSGTGTTLLHTTGVELNARFGPGSAAAHSCSGATSLAPGWPGLRCDVDTVTDLAAALRLGVGPATAAVLDAMGTAGTVQDAPDSALVVRGDQGSTITCPPTAAALGGWRQLRTGQRVRVHRNTAGEVVLVTTAPAALPG